MRDLSVVGVIEEVAAQLDSSQAAPIALVRAKSGVTFMTLSLNCYVRIVHRWSLERQLSAGQTGTSRDRCGPSAASTGRLS